MKDVTQAVVLAAGASSRFYPYGSVGHKSLVSLCGKTLLLRTIESLKRIGVKHVIIVENINESASKSLKNEELEGIRVTFVIQEQATGMGDALLCTTKYLQDNFFLLSAYHFEIYEFAKEMSSARTNEGDLVLLTKNTNDASSFGAIAQVNGKTVIAEKEKEGNADKIVGIYLLTKDFIFHLHQEKKDHYNFENALSSYSDSKTLVLVNTKKETLSLKYPWDLLSVKDYLLFPLKTKISKLAKVSPQAVLKGLGIVVEEGATIMDGAVINGPCYIGKNAYVGTNAVIRGGVCIEADCVVGAQLEIKNSILLNDATTHSGFIGDCVIGENTKIAAGFHTANVRLNRQEIFATVNGKKIKTYRKYFGAIIGSRVSIGIKVGTMPGVIIGNNVVIGPGTSVMENIEDNVTFYTEFKGIIKKRNTSKITTSS